MRIKGDQRGEKIPLFPFFFFPPLSYKSRRGLGEFGMSLFVLRNSRGRRAGIGKSAGEMGEENLGKMWGKWEEIWEKMGVEMGGKSWKK